jgi:hypothetical protein
MPGRNPFRGKGLHNGIEDGIPDGTTLWLFRKTLAKAGLIEKLFEGFGQHLEAKGYIARGGQMVYATIVPVPKQRNSRDENDDVKVGKTPEAWEKNTAFPFVRPGLSLSEIGRRSCDRPHSKPGSSPCRGPALTSARLMFDGAPPLLACCYVCPAPTPSR